MPERHRTVPIAGTITRVPGGYPDKLVVYQLAASRFWWVRYYSRGSVSRKSTKTTNKREAFAFARKFYEDILVRERNLLPITQSPTFERVANQLLSEQQDLINRGERNAALNVNDRQKLERDMLPFFSGSTVRDITHAKINGYLSKLAERNLAPATLKIHLSLLHKILALARRDGLLDRLPSMPRIRTVDSPRGWFTQPEYERLRSKARELASERFVVSHRPITDEMRHLITFMVNSFLRPSDIKTLRHRNIEIVEGDHTYLRIQTHADDPKTVNHPIVTMEAAVNIYRSLMKFHEAKGFTNNGNDFVFLPDMKNRNTAIQVMSRQFDAVLKSADLKTAPTGQSRTLYSLRHTAIMFRLTLGEGIDLLTLAKNARTSVEMIQRFYGNHLQAEMNIGMIQSIRPTGQPAAKVATDKKTAAKRTPAKKAPAKTAKADESQRTA